MGNRYWKQLAVLGGALSLFAFGAVPALAVDKCPAGTAPSFTAVGVYVSPEAADPRIWSGDVNLHAACGTDPLSGVAVTGIYATSNGKIPGLMASADGSLPTTLLNVFTGKGYPTDKTFLAAPASLATDANGDAHFLLRLTSTDPDFGVLTAPDGGTQIIGAEIQEATGTGIDPSTGGLYDIDWSVKGSIFAATPELDSLALFGSGALGLVGYGMMRIRARRKNDLS
jgi:hypothetical protein